MRATTLAFLLSLLVSSNTPANRRPDCARVAQELNSSDYEVFSRGLQGLLDGDCTELLPRVAGLLALGKAPLPYRSTLTLWHIVTIVQDGTDATIDWADFDPLDTWPLGMPLSPVKVIRPVVERSSCRPESRGPS